MASYRYSYRVPRAKISQHYSTVLVPVRCSSVAYEPWYSTSTKCYRCTVRPYEPGTCTRTGALLLVLYEIYAEYEYLYESYRPARPRHGLAKAAGQPSRYSTGTRTGTAHHIIDSSRRHQVIANAFVLSRASRSWLYFLSVSQGFAVCHKMRPYRRDAVVAILPKK